MGSAREGGVSERGGLRPLPKDGWSLPPSPFTGCRWRQGSGSLKLAGAPCTLNPDPPLPFLLYRAGHMAGMQWPALPPSRRST